MRRLYPRLILVTLVATTALLMGGCGASDPVDSAVKPGSGVALNPTGKPATPEDAARASQMQQAGNAMNADQKKFADEMRAAKERTGGK